MVFLTLSKKVTGVIGPFLFRSGLAARNVLLWRQAAAAGANKDSPYLDMLLLIPYAQKLISLTVYDESARVVTQYKHDTTRLERALDDTYDALFGKSTNNDEDEQQQKQKAASVADLRIQVLDDNLRPALIPNDRWSDVMKWRWNVRVLKWARTEFLVSKYGPEVKEALDAYPQLRASPQLTRHPTQRMLMDLARGRAIDLSSKPNNTKPKKTMLPSSETLLKAFGMRQWATQKYTKRVRQTMIPIAEKLGGSVLELEEGVLLNHAEIPLDANLYDLSVEELLEVTGGHVVNCGPFNVVCEEADIYQLWTQEYVQHLGKYLLDRSMMETKKETVIVDVGAGDGLLIHFLKEYMETEFHKRRKNSTHNKSNNKHTTSLPTLIATDDGSWGIFAKAEVEKLNAQDTLANYGGGATPITANDGSIEQQLIVLCSWMPMGQDWSAMFRAAGADEYILIGEADDGTCGHNWDTWGNVDFRDDVVDENDNAISSSSPPPPSYVFEGYQRWDMDVLSQFQFSRFDCAVSRSSKTVSFRRKKR